MSSNLVVTYIDMGLNSVEAYWDGLVVPNVRAYQIEPSPPSLFNAAQSVWHLHDWVWHDRNPGKDSSGPDFRAYRRDLLDTCPQLGWLRDIADAGKIEDWVDYRKSEKRTLKLSERPLGCSSASPEK
jgi:hypothetical protein